MEIQQCIVELAREKGILRPRDLKTCGIPDIYLLRLLTKGILVRVGRGLYSLPNGLTGESRHLIEITKRVPHAVVCLLSALQFHHLTTQAPSETWIAIQSPGWKPKIEYPPVRVVWFSGMAFDFGVEQHSIENVRVKIYSPAKTVVDCFKYRNKIGLDVALEAAREALRERKVTMEQLWQAAKICRVAKVMQPYLEAIS
jgi:predicted transcriptional regulator of viral defense system